MSALSIITPLFNKGRYVDETIRSVRAQTLADWEMIVVDNGSTDDGPEQVRRLAGEDCRIRLVSSPKRGPGAARNFGLGLATGEWVLFLDADDLLVPDYLEERLGILQNHPGADLLAGCWEEFKDDAPNHKTIRKPAAYGGTEIELANAAIAYAPWALHAALVKKSRLLNGRLWPEELDELPSEDTAFWFPVVYDASIAWSNRAGALYRIQTATSRNEIHDANRWVRAVIGVIQHNVQFLRVKGMVPGAEQCANIVRVLESTYRLGLSKRSREAASMALNQANAWLANCPFSTPAFMLRKIFGLRLFNFIRHGLV